MSESSPKRNAINSERLQLMEFSFITPAGRVREAQARRITELSNKQHLEQRVIGTAYYALELCSPMLKPFDDAISQLQTMEPGTDEAIKLIDDVMLADAVRAEIVRSFNTYGGLPRDLIVDRTAQFTSKNTGWLKAIDQMRNARNPQKRIGPHTGRVSEAVARLTIARQAGIQISLPE